ncbi:MAG: YebC/PmpR family DNA-binding transcriptional regulator [Clostridia bacterium]|nr:YebC/PmpR family DNA-binding transcriptional regulator [Clostridia bacterium]MBQ3869754.1 YebC/PmpR family DNA-binding transcriptional regulator [Clostridia bacterium]
MSGHSKWKNIMHKKEKTDAARAKVFTKIGKEMAIAVREGGPDPVSNSKLRDLISKAKANNVPNDNIDRIIKKASGADSVAYEKVIYEGYGIGGVAVIVEAMTDNRNRTGGDIRHYFDKFGGNLGQTGCVSYLFTDKGTIIVENDGKVSEDEVMDSALEAGAEDFDATDEAFEITTAPEDLDAVTAALTEKGYKILSSEQEKIPSMYVTLTDEEQLRKMNLLIEKLEENDDVTDFWHNLENEE